MVLLFKQLIDYRLQI